MNYAEESGFLEQQGIHQPGILFQRLAGVHQLLILSVVDVQHGDPDFDVAFAIIGVAQFQYLFFRLLLRPVVKTDADGPGDKLERTAVLVVIARGDETY